VTDGSAPPGERLAQDTDDWPEGVQPINFDGIGHLGVGADGRLYWKGKPVEVARTFSLSRWQRAGAFLTVTAATVAAAAAVVSAWADLQGVP
jgi:homospermidine synthase